MIFFYTFLFLNYLCIIFKLQPHKIIFKQLFNKTRNEQIQEKYLVVRINNEEVIML